MVVQAEARQQPEGDGLGRPVAGTQGQQDQAQLEADQQRVDLRDHREGPEVVGDGQRRCGRRRRQP